jgi:anti-sigma regulatory factor (Ser/Thr protein kinase)
MDSDTRDASPPCRPSLALTVPNVLASVETARQAMLAHLRGADVSERALYQLELVLEEALMNRVWHAFPQGGQHAIDLVLELLPDALSLSVEDEGVAFDPMQAPPQRPAASLAEAEPGGLGLLLTRKAALSCTYLRQGGRNRFTVLIARR